MLRRFLFYLSSAGWARHIVTHWRLARRVARRFVAGETMDEAVGVTANLNAQGLFVTLDYLGENVTEAGDAERVVETYSHLLKRIHGEGLQAGLSVKLTHLGLDISEELCQSNVRQILSVAKEHDLLVTIDMEGSAYTDATLRIYRTMRDDNDFDNVGTVIQANLFRSADDMRKLASEGARIRLVKGAYLEPPEIAFSDKADVDANFVELADVFLQAPPPAYLSIATHDERMIETTERLIEKYDVPLDRYEFQMLYGIRSDRQLELVKEGYKVRIYVPFGEEWYPYFMRRLAERPANLWFFIRALLGR